MTLRFDWRRWVGRPPYINPMRHDCPECQRLWREYAAATNSHVGLENKLRTAALERESPAAAALEREVEAAAKARESLRDAIQQHEAAAHGRTADVDG
jgi:predicted  nucleic acid-binding Zn-ribbon protein